MLKIKPDPSACAKPWRPRLSTKWGVEKSRTSRENRLWQRARDREDRVSRVSLKGFRVHVLGSSKILLNSQTKELAYIDV